MTSSSRRNGNKTIDVVCKSEICTYLPGSSDKFAMGPHFDGDAYSKIKSKLIFKTITVVIYVYSYLHLFITD